MMLCMDVRYLAAHGIDARDRSQIAGYFCDSGQPTVHFNILRERGIDTRGHLILGLPGETREMLLGACDRINDLPLTGVKLHQLQILKGTPMALEYVKHPEDFLMPDLTAYIELLAEMIGRFRADLRIDRIAAAVPPRFLAVSPWSGVRPDHIRVLLEKKLAEKGNPISPSPG